MNKTDARLVRTAGFLPLTQGAQSIQGVLQRKCACGNHTIAGGECAECNRKKQALQRKASDRNPVSGAEVSSIAPPIVHAVLRSSGQPLDAQTQALMAFKFGQDFSRVRVHTGTQAAESARQVNALAYTVGQDIVFGNGRYSPHTREGQQLVAHELVHTIQQDGRRTSMAGTLRIGNPGDRYEQEADRVADQIVAAPAQSAPGGVHLPPHAGPLQVARLVADAEGAAEPLIPLESGATPMARGPECSRQRNRGQSLPLVRTAFRGERGFAYIPSDGHPGPGGLLVTGNSVSIKISARWEEQIPDPDQRPPDQRSRRADRPQYYLSFNGWVDDCDSTNAGGPASSIQTANLAIGTEHTVNLASLIPGRYGLQVNPSTASAEPNRVLAGTCEVT
ncbi:MAG: DUF4157 domain-containing protein [Nitrosomonas sp.]|nr:DUF4157 domain-containing protein [Nitrosomonas sp.]